MTKATRTINFKLSELGHKLLRTLSAESGLTYAKTIELALATLDETADHGIPEPRPERRKETVTIDVPPPVERPTDPQEEARYYAAVRQGLLADDGDFPEDPPGAAEGALEGNDEAASACAVSSPSAAADPRVESVTSQGDTEPAPPPVVEEWMAELFEQV